MGLSTVNIAVGTARPLFPISENPATSCPAVSAPVKRRRNGGARRPRNSGTAWKALSGERRRGFKTAKTSEIQPLLEDGGKVKNYSIFPDDENRRFAVYYLELEPGSYWQSEPHLRGTIEFITIFWGTLEIEADDKLFSVAKGESIRFRGDTIHSYRNAGAETTILHMILYNP